MSIVNLLPVDYVEKRSRRRANIMCMVLFSIIMAAVFGAKAASENNIRHTMEVRDRLNAEYASAAKFISQIEKLQVKKAKLLHKAKLSSLLLEHVPRSLIMAVITNAMPDSASLLKLELELRHKIAKTNVLGKKGRKSSSKFATVAKQQRNSKPPTTTIVLEVTGLAGTDVDVARFIANVARNPMIRMVDLVYSQEKMIDKIAVREFQVSIELSSEADAIGGQKAALRAAAARSKTTQPNTIRQVGSMTGYEAGGRP